MKSDSELLRYFARTNSEDAFAELVKRYLNLVYSAALRQVDGDEHLAKDVAQNIFADLARKAKPLSHRQNLSGWLYTSTRFAAAKMTRAESRRRGREEKFMREPLIEPAPDTEWEKLRFKLDEVMHELKETDREAILLRYFENRPFTEVGAKLGLNENAARMRVDRAVEKLRAIFAKRGVATTSALTAAISANAVQFAPASLAAMLPGLAVTSAGTGTFSLLQLMTTAKVKLGLATLLVASGATAIVLQHQNQQKLTGQNDALRHQITQLHADNQNLSNRLLSIHQPKSTPTSDDNSTELLKLRGEVDVLRRQAKQANEKAATAQKRLETFQSVQAQFKTKEDATIGAMKYLGLDMRVYESDHNNQFPTNQSLYRLVKNYDSNTNLLQGIPYIEFINTHAVKINSQNQINHPNMVVLRERIARQAPDGTWHRLYGFADGSVQTAISYDGDFTAWEKANTYIPPSKQNR